MNTKRDKYLALKVAKEIVTGMVNATHEEQVQYLDFYLQALSEAYQVQNLSQDEYHLLRDIVFIIVNASSPD